MFLRGQLDELMGAFNYTVVARLKEGVSREAAAAELNAAALVVVISAAACWIPARRATRVDPLESLRYE